MKRTILVGGLGVVLLVALVAAGLLVTHAWPGGSGQQRSGSSTTRVTVTPAGTKVVLVPAIGLELPAHQRPTPTPTVPPKKTPTPGATPTEAQQQPQPTSPPATQPTPAPTQVAPPAASSAMTAEENNLAQQLFAQINSDRATNGRPAYSSHTSLVTSAYKHDQQMNQPSCGMSHQCPGEPNVGTRIRNEGLDWSTCGENVGYASGYSDHWQAVLVIHQSMMAEQPPNDGHRQNLLSQSFHHIGIAIYISGNTVWLTEDFAD